MIISWILVILWASIIFFMSCMDTNESNNSSKSTINTIIEKSTNVSSKLGITSKPNTNKVRKITEYLNVPLRKVAHATEYLIFTILLIIALKSSGLKGKKVYFIALLICFLYACTDEYHQTFVKGRTGQFTDTLIDTLGGLIGFFLVIILNKYINKRNESKNWLF